MTPQEKMRWFWSVGIVPGSLLGDTDDRRIKLPSWNRRDIQLTALSRKQEKHPRNIKRSSGGQKSV